MTIKPTEIYPMVPNPTWRADVRDFAAAIALLCGAHHASVTSWIRTPIRNKQVGGATESQHLDGLAADLATDDPKHHARLVASAKQMGLIAVDEGDHVHIQKHPRPNPLKGKSLFPE